MRSTVYKHSSFLKFILSTTLGESDGPKVYQLASEQIRNLNV